MSDLPLISVIVPVYNVEKYLNRCVESIVGQTYDNLEILLVDDGSTDDSGILCDAWSERDERVRVIHKKNGGAGAARNIALDMAKGEFVGLVDSDDYLAPHMYAHLYSLIQHGADIAECTIVWTESDNAPMDDGSAAEVHYYSTEQAMQLSIREEAFCQTPPNKLYRRSTITDVRFPEGNLIDDEFWTYQVIGNAGRLAHSSSCMYAYRQQIASAMHKPYSLKRLQGLDARLQRLRYLQQHMPSLEYEAKNDLFFSCLFSMQSCLRYLTKEELDIAREKISAILEQIKPIPSDPQASAKKNLLLKAAQKSFENTCRVLNFLIDIHVLS